MLEEVGILKITIIEAVLSEETQHMKLVDPYVQFRYRDYEKRTQKNVATITTGRVKNRSQFNETFKFQVFAWDDEIAFQLRDDDKTKKYAQDNILGEYRATMKEFIKDSGTEKWYKLTTQLEGWT